MGGCKIHWSYVKEFVAYIGAMLRSFSKVALPTCGVLNKEPTGLNVSSTNSRFKELCPHNFLGGRGSLTNKGKPNKFPSLFQYGTYVEKTNLRSL